MKLNLGAGKTIIEGFEARDGAQGDVLYPLPDADGTVDEIRASHVLEHFPHAQVPAVLADWVRVLKPGGILKVAVPDFQEIAERYLAGTDLDVQGYLMGGQIDERDFHRAVFDREELDRALAAAGLIALREWKSELKDGASLPISLNLAGTKPGAPREKIAAVISMPRLGFNDFWNCALTIFMPRGIPLRRVMGVYWERKLTQAFEEVLAEERADWILALDYDTVFTGAQIDTLLDLARRHPEADAIAPIQSSRHHTHPMLTVVGADGKNMAAIGRAELNEELLKISTAHFGCTLIRAEKLRALPRPWLVSTPDGEGLWGEHALDADIWFWKQWQKAGNSLYCATRVPVGHVDMTVRWPDTNLETIYQTPHQFLKDGPPDNVWR